MGSCWAAGLTDGKGLGQGRDDPKPEFGGQVSAGLVYGICSAQPLRYPVGRLPHGLLLISDRERRTLPPAMMPTDSGSKLVRRL